MLERYGDFPPYQDLTHDAATLVQAAKDRASTLTLTTCQDPVKKVNLGSAKAPKPILLASWLWDQPLLLDQVIAFMKPYQDVFAWS